MFFALVVDPFCDLVLLAQPVCLLVVRGPMLWLAVVIVAFNKGLGTQDVYTQLETVLQKSSIPFHVLLLEDEAQTLAVTTFQKRIVRGHRCCSTMDCIFTSGSRKWTFVQPCDGENGPLSKEASEQAAAMALAPSSSTTLPKVVVGITAVGYRPAAVSCGGSPQYDHAQRGAYSLLPVKSEMINSQRFLKHFFIEQFVGGCGIHPGCRFPRFLAGRAWRCREEQVELSSPTWCRTSAITLPSTLRNWL